MPSSRSVWICLETPQRSTSEGICNVSAGSTPETAWTKSRWGGSDQRIANYIKYLSLPIRAHYSKPLVRLFFATLIIWTNQRWESIDTHVMFSCFFFSCQNGTADAASMAADDIYAAGLCYGLELAAGESYNRVGRSLQRTQSKICVTLLSPVNHNVKLLPSCS